MKLIKFIIPAFIVTAALLLSCKNNSQKNTDLDKKWVLVGMGGVKGDRLPDSVKQIMYGTRFMEFTSEGEMIATGGRSMMQKGTYTLSADGKQVYTVIREKPADTMFIDKLTKDTLVISIKRDSMQLIMIAK